MKWLLSSSVDSDYGFNEGLYSSCPLHVCLQSELKKSHTINCIILHIDFTLSDLYLYLTIYLPSLAICKRLSTFNHDVIPSCRILSHSILCNLSICTPIIGMYNPSLFHMKTIIIISMASIELNSIHVVSVNI